MNTAALIISSELQIVIGVLTGLFVGMLIYIWKRQIKKTDDLGKELLDYKLLVTRDYVTHEHLKELKEGLFKRWDKMEFKLDEYIKTTVTSIGRKEFESFKDIMNERFLDLEKRKIDKPRIST